MSDCEHKYVYLRQERRNVGYDRNPTWVVADVYFCERCLAYLLAYRRVDVEKRTPRSDSFDEHVQRLV